MLDASVRLPRAAYAVGTTPKALSHWLAAGLPLLAHAERRGGAWHRVAPLDLIRLAVVRRLLPYGFSVAEAEGILARSVDGLLLAYPMSGLPCCWAIVQAKLFGRSLAVSRDPDGRIRVGMDTLGDARGAERLTLDLQAIAAETRARLETRASHKES